MRAIGLYNEFLSVTGDDNGIEMLDIGATVATVQPHPFIVWTVSRISRDQSTYQLRNNFTHLCLYAHWIVDMGHHFVGGSPCNASDVSQHWRFLQYTTAVSKLLFYELQHAVHGSSQSPWCVRVPSMTANSPNAVLDTCSIGDPTLERHTYFVLLPVLL
ncbi:hypothetical protein H310_10050 [Aphanomyces invadans]|uniref:Uncharacterized protein n=1 Tax=Aphanomyces invadans TaxID=157072 RepID=A0A024TRT2_9STRA|nr:hypothetical protein H310_10050 [Aphanomyces invadans]ETV96733.1 hypothetical protein H310_10050 [Aphanomyces invadans]|eukprot:XP_008874510.1 hypothetical protein H310_10050 [Aphanomyces invadans]